MLLRHTKPFAYTAERSLTMSHSSTVPYRTITAEQTIRVFLLDDHEVSRTSC